MPQCTWAYLAALASYFLGVVAGVLSRAGKALAVLAAVLTGTQDAGQRPKGTEGGVPHLPMGVGLSTVHTSWAREPQRIDLEPRKGGKGPKVALTPTGPSKIVKWSCPHFPLSA